MNIQDFENYIFDLDGTIIDSSKGVLNCFAQAFQKSNIQIDKSRLNSDVIGPPLKDILVNIHPAIKDDDKKIDEVILNFRSIYDNCENDDSSLYEGIEDKDSEEGIGIKKQIDQNEEDWKKANKKYLDENEEIKNKYINKKYSKEKENSEIKESVENILKKIKDLMIKVNDNV